MEELPLVKSMHTVIWNCGMGTTQGTYESIRVFLMENFIMEFFQYVISEMACLNVHMTFVNQIH